MNKSQSIKNMEELTGLKKSQIHCYKKIIKQNKIEELKTTAFRKVLRSCTDSVSDSPGPQASATGDAFPQSSPQRPWYERPHFFSEIEYSSDRTSFARNDYCPCGLDIDVDCRPGQRLAHIPILNYTGPTYLNLFEISAFNYEIEKLKNMVKSLQTENKELRSENERLRK